MCSRVQVGLLGTLERWLVDVGRGVLTRSMGIVLSIFGWSVRFRYLGMPSCLKCWSMSHDGIAIIDVEDRSTIM